MTIETAFGVSRVQPTMDIKVVEATWFGVKDAKYDLTGWRYVRVFGGGLQASNDLLAWTNLDAITEPSVVVEVPT